MVIKYKYTHNGESKTLPVELVTLQQADYEYLGHQDGQVFWLKKDGVFYRYKAETKGLIEYGENCPEKFLKSLEK